MCDKCDDLNGVVSRPLYTVEVNSSIVTLDLGAFQVDMDLSVAREMGELLFRRGCEAAPVSELRGDSRGG